MYLFPNSQMAVQRPRLSQSARYLSGPPRRYRRLRLGQLVSGTISSAVQSQFFPSTSSTAGFTQNDLNNFILAVQTRYIPTQFITDINGCSISAQPLSQVPGATAAMATTSAGTAAIKIAPATGPAAPFVAAAGAVLDLIGSIFGAKAAKEQTEDEVLCQQLNNANQSLAAIDAALEAGTMTGAQATQAYAYLVSQYQSAVQSAGILRTPSATSCDASCVFLRMLNGIVAQRNLDLTTNPPPADVAAAGGTASSVVTSAAAAITASGIPAWAWALGGIGLLYWLL